MSDTRIDFLYLNEKDMIDAGVLDAGHCVETMEEVLCLLAKGDVLWAEKSERAWHPIDFSKGIRNPRLPP